MSTLFEGMAEHLKATEAFAYAARNAIQAGMPETALESLETVIASLREAQASLAHEADLGRLLGEARCPAPYCDGSGTVEQYRTGTGEMARTKCTWCVVRAAALIDKCEQSSVIPSEPK